DKVTPGLVKVFAKNGGADTIAEWVWKRKGSLFVGAALATFVANPEAYLDTAEAVADKALDVAVKPLADVPLAVASEAAANTNWTAIILCLAVVLGIAGWYWSSPIRAANSILDRLRPQQNGENRPKTDE